MLHQVAAKGRSYPFQTLVGRALLGMTLEPLLQRHPEAGSSDNWSSQVGDDPQAGVGDWGDIMEKKRSLPIGREHTLPSTSYPGCYFSSDWFIVLARLQQKTASLEQEPTSEYTQTWQSHRVSSCARLPS